VFIHRAKGEYSREDYEKWLAPEKSAVWWRWAARGIAFLPSGAARLTLLGYFALANKQGLAWWRR
jgi:hypothetical protein